MRRKRKLIQKKNGFIYFLHQTQKLPDRNAKHGIDITAATDERTVQEKCLLSFEVCSIHPVILFQPVNRCFCIGKIFPSFCSKRFMFCEKDKPWQIAHGFHTLTSQSQLNVLQNNFWISSIKFQLNCKMIDKHASILC